MFHKNCTIQKCIILVNMVEKTIVCICETFLVYGMLILIWNKIHGDKGIPMIALWCNHY